MDVMSILTTVAGLPAVYRTHRAWVSRIAAHKVSPAIVLFCCVCLLMLEGCAGLARSESKSSVDVRQPAERLMTFRTLGSDQQFSELSSVTAAEQLRATRAGRPLTILALSGGGAGGAFGAGAVAGRSLCLSRALVGCATPRCLYRRRRRQLASIPGTGCDFRIERLQR